MDNKLLAVFMGELGHEIVTCVPTIRSLSQKYNLSLATYQDTFSLYKDISVNLIKNTVDDPGPPPIDDRYKGAVWLTEATKNHRMPLDNMKIYDPTKLGNERVVKEIRSDLIFSRLNNLIAIHARFQEKHQHKNWTDSFNHVTEKLIKNKFDIVYVGHPKYSIAKENGLDGRDENIETLIIWLKKCKCLVGPMSGPIHLAQWVSTPVFIWNHKDKRVFPGCDPYWNPFQSPAYTPAYEYDELSYFKGRDISKTEFERGIDNLLKSF